MTSFGTGELVELDARSLDPAMSVRRSFQVGDGPSGLDVDPSTGIAVVWSQLSHEVAVVNLGSGSVERSLSRRDPMSGVWPSAGVCSTRKVTGASRAAAGPAHRVATEGRADGLVWRLGGGARRALLPRWAPRSGPYGWNGEHAMLEDNIDKTIKRLGGTGLGRPELSALAAYIKTGLVPPPATVVPAAAQAMVARGKVVFESDQVGCVWCRKARAGGQ